VRVNRRPNNPAQDPVSRRSRTGKAFRSKISNPMITELFYSHILNMNRGSLHKRSFRRIRNWKWLCGPEKFPGLSRNGSCLQQVHMTWDRYPTKNQHLVSCQPQKTTRSRWAIIWARDMAMWYWSANTLFWQVSIDHNMDVQYQRRTV